MAGDKMKTIAFITRVHPGRPNMLKECVESVKAQTSNDYVHILHRDDNTGKGYGVPMANQSLQKIKTVDARYAMILDDDDMLVDQDFVDLFAKVTEKDAPEMVFFKGEIMDRGIYPREWRWGRGPLCGSIASFCFAVRRDVWEKYIHMFKQRPAGDFSFVSHCYEMTEDHLWLDRIVARTQKRAGRGKGEREHA